MKPAEIDLSDDLEIYQGDYYLLDVYIFNEDETDTIDLTAYSAPRAQIRATSGATSTLATFTATIDADQVNNRGLVTLVLLEADTDAIPATGSQLWVWDFELVDGDSHTLTFIRGSVTVVEDVSHD